MLEAFLKGFRGSSCRWAEKEGGWGMGRVGGLLLLFPTLCFMEGVAE